jgi:hypothetical protein
MNLMPRVSTCRALVQLALLLCSFGLQAGQQTMNEISERYTGTWSVVAVRVNGTAVQAYGPDDPALMKMKVVVGADTVRAGTTTCKEPQVREERVPFDKLLRSTYDASPAEMGLPRNDLPEVVTLFIACRTGGFGPDIERGSWIAQWGSGFLAMSWMDGALLLLKRE